MSIRIPITKDAHSKQSILLDGSYYGIELKWVSVAGGFWAMSLYNSAEEPLVYGIRMVLNYPLGFGLSHRGTPPGVLMCIDFTGSEAEIARYDFVNERGVWLLYFTREEATDLGYPV